MNTRNKLFSIFSLLILAMLVFTPVALAFDGRSADRVVIGADEVINDDLYLSGREVIVDGTINGDLLVAGETVIVNGQVTGDLWAAGREVTVNGKVGDDLFAAAAAVTLGSDANITDDVLSAGASVESKAGSQIGGALLIGAYQGLVSGAVAEDLFSGTSRLRLEGNVAGDAKIAVDTDDDNFTPGPMMFGPNMPPMPSVPAGLTFGDEANIAGQLEYTARAAISIPSGVASQVQYLLPPVDAQVSREINRNDGPGSAILDGLRRLIALLLVGLLITRLVPAWIVKPADKMQARLLPSLGIGLLGIIMVPFILLTGLALVIFAAVLVGALTLGELVGVILAVGLPTLILVGIVFFVALGYLPQAAVAYLGGRWILQRVRPESAENIYGIMLVGLVALGILLALPVLGGLIEFVVVLTGLGAIALLFWESRQRPATAVAQ
jgi:cytoskeletal protein CcmA (bactofilin family)